MSHTLPLSQSFDLILRHYGKLWRSDELAQQGLQLSINEYDYLMAVQALSKPRLSDLANEMGVTKPSASNMVSKLEKRALLQRAPSAEDGRVVLIQLTAQGEELMALDRKIYDSLTKKIHQQISDEDYQTLERLLSLACQQL